MPIVIRCTGCSRKYRVQDHLIGKIVKCPKCQTRFSAEQTQDSGPRPTAPDSAPVLTAAEPLTPPPTPAAAQASPVAQTPSSVPEAIPATPAPPKNPPSSAPKPPTPPLSSKPFVASPLMIFGIIAGILAFAGMIGLAIGSLLAGAVQN